MLTLTTKIRVDGLTGREVTDFLIRATDEQYRRWWKGTHLHYRTIRWAPRDVGNLIYFEEFVGKHHERTKAKVIQLDPGRRLVMQVRRVIPLPIWLDLELEDGDGGVTITQRVRAGYEGAGRILDPLFRLYFSPEYAQALDEHAWTEFPMLRDMLGHLGPHGSAPGHHSPGTSR